MKKVTLKEALNSGACYTDTQIKALFGKRKTLTVKQIVALNIPDKDKVWALTRSHFLDTKEKAVRFAVFCAEQCIEHFEKRFPDDKRPRGAIEAAKAWLQNPTAADAAARAADAADVAVRAARAADAAYAADAADAVDAVDAARAAYAADVAAYAADVAAYAAYAADVAVRAAYAADAAAYAADVAVRAAARAADAAARAAADAADAAARAADAADAARAAQVKFLIKLLTEGT